MNTETKTPTALETFFADLDRLTSDVDLLVADWQARLAGRDSLALTLWDQVHLLLDGLSISDLPAAKDYFTALVERDTTQRDAVEMLARWREIAARVPKLDRAIKDLSTGKSVYAEKLTEAEASAVFRLAQTAMYPPPPPQPVEKPRWHVIKTKHTCQFCGWELSGRLPLVCPICNKRNNG